MMAMAREEAALIATDAAVAARNSLQAEAGAAARAAGAEAALALNPLAVRTAAEASAKQAMQGTETSVFQGLTHATPPVPGSAGTITSTTSTVTTTVLAESSAAMATATTTTTTTTTTALSGALRSATAEVAAAARGAHPERGGSTVISQILEAEGSATVKEALSNASETGAEAVGGNVVQIAEALLEGQPVSLRGAGAVGQQ
ncbi:hypothetical protein Q8F55_006145 [Vanrija albida]|uniref:SMP domain-containing protein n=1 Tax=Vanrija albida TaxID=181172 RepID=A0ABR3PWN8_9TREE